MAVVDPALKTLLVRQFFGPGERFEEGSDDLKEFDAFNASLRRVAQQREFVPPRASPPPSGVPVDPFADIPRVFDPLLRLNCRLSLRPVAPNGPLRAFMEEAAQFARSLHFYEDFLQRKRFQQLSKLLRDQKSLPIASYEEEIVEAVRSNQVVIIAGDTGCGKSTQVPRFLLRAGFRKIACTQPRRIACSALAKRVSYETLKQYGSTISYQFRFESTRTRATRVLFLTEGLLLRLAASDPLLMEWDVVILDEVHERHVTCDFLLGVLRRLVRQRPRLKLILMSATINSALFSSYFGGAPIVQVPGRAYPVSIEYVPPLGQEDLDLLDEAFFQQRMQGKKAISVRTKSAPLDPEPYLKIMERIDAEVPPTERGDLIVFLSGINEIGALAEAVKEYAAKTKRWIVLLLHSSLSVEEQDRVFDYAPEGMRKCILSTNIAETSVTIDGVRFIIDSGKVKEMSHDASARIMKLQEFWVSKASAEQRAGRAGRTGPGRCFRLYSRNEFVHFNDFPVSEIHRVPIEHLVLQIRALGLGDPRRFEFIEPPDLDRVNEAVRFLQLHGALTQSESVTSLGRVLSLLPVDVVIGKMLILGTTFDLVDATLTLAASLSVQSPFLRPTERSRGDKVYGQRAFSSEHGDAFTLLNLVNAWVRVKADGRGSARWCRQNDVEEQRLYEILKLKKQFEETLMDNQLLTPHTNPTYFDRRRSRNRKRDAEEERRQQRRELKRARMLQSTRKRAVLRPEDDSAEGDVLSGDIDTFDVRSMDFELSHDLDELQAAAAEHEAMTLRDVVLLKYILVSGLYPQVAVPDPNNSMRKDADQIFVTRGRHYCLLHPTSVLTMDFAALRPVLDYKGTGPRPDLLCYVQLLQTAKPYLMNIVRVPALAMLLLFAESIDTTEAGDRIVFDNFFAVSVAPDQAARLLVAAHQFRLMLGAITDKRLRHVGGSGGLAAAALPDQTVVEMDVRDGGEENSVLPAWVRRIRAMTNDGSGNTTEREFSQKCAEFLELSVPHRLEILREADVHDIFADPQALSPGADDDGAQAKPPGPVIKRGLRVTPYLRYGSVAATAGVPTGFSNHMRKRFKCGRCGQDLMLNRAELLAHVTDCERAHERSDSAATPVSAASAAACARCGVDLASMTAMQRLRHARSHDAADAAMGSF